MGQYPGLYGSNMDYCDFDYGFSFGFGKDDSTFDSYYNGAIPRRTSRQPHAFMLVPSYVHRRYYNDRSRFASAQNQCRHRPLRSRVDDKDSDEPKHQSRSSSNDIGRDFMTCPSPRAQHCRVRDLPARSGVPQKPEKQSTPLSGEQPLRRGQAPPPPSSREQSELPSQLLPSDGSPAQPDGCASRSHDHPSLIIHVISYSIANGKPLAFMPAFNIDARNFATPKNEMCERYTGRDPEFANTLFNTADHEVLYQRIVADAKNTIRVWRHGPSHLKRLRC